jgi:hypothetical protein
LLAVFDSIPLAANSIRQVLFSIGPTCISVKNPYYICTAVADLFIVQPGGFLRRSFPKALLTELINEPVRYLFVALFRLPFSFTAA